MYVEMVLLFILADISEKSSPYHQVLVETAMLQFRCFHLAEGEIPTPEHTVTILMFLIHVFQIFTEAVHRTV